MGQKLSGFNASAMKREIIGSMLLQNGADYLARNFRLEIIVAAKRKEIN